MVMVTWGVGTMSARLSQARVRSQTFLIGSCKSQSRELQIAKIHGIFPQDGGQPVGKKSFCKSQSPRTANCKNALHFSHRMWVTCGGKKSFTKTF
jgi:hypothetical protein